MLFGIPHHDSVFVTSVTREDVQVSNCGWWLWPDDSIYPVLVSFLRPTIPPSLQIGQLNSRVLE
jgi:hypothetical protein